METLSEFCRRHPDFSLVPGHVRVQSRMLGREFDGNNIMHLQRMVNSRKYKHLLRARSMSPPPEAYCLPISDEVKMIPIPTVIADRIESIAAALALHVSLAHRLEVNFHSLGEALRAAQICVSEVEHERMMQIATESNRARHAEMLKVTEDLHVVDTGCDCVADLAPPSAPELFSLPVDGDSDDVFQYFSKYCIKMRSRMWGPMQQRFNGRDVDKQDIEQFMVPLVVDSFFHDEPGIEQNEKTMENIRLHAQLDIKNVVSGLRTVPRSGSLDVVPCG